MIKRKRNNNIILFIYSYPIQSHHPSLLASYYLHCTLLAHRGDYKCLPPCHSRFNSVGPICIRVLIVSCTALLLNYKCILTNVMFAGCNLMHCDFQQYSCACLYFFINVTVFLHGLIVTKLISNVMCRVVFLFICFIDAWSQALVISFSADQNIAGKNKVCII